MDNHYAMLLQVFQRGQHGLELVQDVLDDRFEDDDLLFSVVIPATPSETASAQDDTRATPA